MEQMQTARALVSRRSFLGSSAALSLALSGLRADVPGLQIGVTDWNLNLSADPEAVAVAARLGFAGVQVSFGRKLVNDKMPADNPETIGRYREMAKQHGIQIDGTCVDRLHDNGLKSDPLASRWVLDSIRLTKDLNTRVLLLPFFGRWALKTQAEKEHVGDALRELAPEAKKAGVILGLEDTISAEDNVRIMDRSQAENVLVYYDVGNSTVAGFDVVKEIRWLGKERICQFHLKDNPHFLGEGSIQFKPILQAIKDIGWTGWANLETDARPGQRDPDMTRNLAFIRDVIKQV
jgi:L-ribulose-5-phosphate 3-epimerase